MCSRTRTRLGVDETPTALRYENSLGFLKQLNLPSFCLVAQFHFLHTIAIGRQTAWLTSRQSQLHCAVLGYLNPEIRGIMGQNESSALSINSQNGESQKGGTLFCRLCLVKIGWLKNWWKPSPCKCPDLSYWDRSMGPWVAFTVHNTCLLHSTRLIVSCGTPPGFLPRCTCLHREVLYPTLHCSTCDSSALKFRFQKSYYPGSHFCLCRVIRITHPFWGPSF